MKEISSHLDEPATEIPHLHAAKVIFLPEACWLYVRAAKMQRCGIGRIRLWVRPLVSQRLTQTSLATPLIRDLRIAAAPRKEGVQDQGAGCRGSDA